MAIMRARAAKTKVRMPQAALAVVALFAALSAIGSCGEPIEGRSTRDLGTILIDVEDGD